MSRLAEAYRQANRIDGACLAMVRFLGWVYAEAAAQYYGPMAGVPDRHRGLSLAIMNRVMRLASYS